MENTSERFVFSHKELKRAGRSNFKHHYLMFVFTCLIALILQVEFFASDNIISVRRQVITDAAQAAYELVKKNLGDYPIKAVLYSHSHVDHFGGVEGIVSEDQVNEEGILIIAPEGFEEHAVSENVYAGTAMGRRASYQYGTLLEPGEKGSLCIGIGMGQSHGTTSYLSPNTIISQTGQRMVVDGVIMEFQLTPGTEAPAEMNTWFPQKKALWMAENCTGTLHNLYTLRGAQVRDGQAWAEYLMETLKDFVNKRGNNCNWRNSI